MSAEQEAIMERQRDDSLHQQMQADMRQDGQVSQAWLREITQHQLDEGTETLMQNLLTQDMLLGNLQSAEVTELKWLIRELSEEIKRMHPDTNCAVLGEARKAYLDDGQEALTPLSNAQEQWIDQAVLVIVSNITRSKDGFQQEQFSKQVSVTKSDDDDNGSRLGGFFS
jgi:hypothetical protein